MYAISDTVTVSNSPGLVSVRAAGIEYESMQPFRLDVETGYMYNLYPLWLNGKISNYTDIRYMNVSAIAVPMHRKKHTRLSCAL